MKAVGFFESKPISENDALVDIEVAKPKASGRDLLVKIEAIAVNPIDYKMRQRLKPTPESPAILGWDAVGTVEAVGSDCSLFKPGDAVYYAGALTRQGSNAEYQVVDERIVGRKPTTLNATQAAALPLTALTAWELLFDRLQLDVPNPQLPNPVLLVSGAAGGVGSILVQLAVAKTNAIVIGTASRPESKAWVEKLGAHHVIDHSKPLADELKRIGIASVTHVASLVDTSAYYDAFIEALAPQGRLALIDDPQEPLDARPLKRKSLSLHWELMFTRSLFATEDMQAQHVILNAVADLVDTGVIQTTLGQALGPINAKNLKKAHHMLEEGRTIGKLVLTGF
ncbi:zinc-binding alcohol dehydrogenase family protein [Aliidiomarina sanyensis]|uniref:Zinc-type alcohol dehydrogenase-like protein n=1 Tax=Aliidiomarina sanyensis TaxID=1249555 RepID=A0A432WBS2_9GAMM|nr:zinc-binding alcohol dehydrogenase family protein [Aliidiomarina sanyensis]RUO29503.1 zinc-binding alcohol dehydrogenase family protein [Aliidiomarina sanyensis]